MDGSTTIVTIELRRLKEWAAEQVIAAKETNDKQKEDVHTRLEQAAFCCEAFWKYRNTGEV